MRRTRSDTRIFIGSSSESKEIAEYLQLALDAHFETTIWDQGVFTLSTLGLSALLKAPEDFDVAVLIYAADDVTNKRNLEKAAPRDNVIFESGVFM
ncbi:MAG: nucleotide-binding protein, partial [Nitrososphaera sp.]|nr:nucleotide-binding protein [Nitrososphaera sp.]